MKPPLSSCPMHSGIPHSIRPKVVMSDWQCRRCAELRYSFAGGASRFAADCFPVSLSNHSLMYRLHALSRGFRTYFRLPEMLWLPPFGHPEMPSSLFFEPHAHRQHQSIPARR
jgi:hypothetical protein